jgi:hypothetical protein
MLIMNDATRVAAAHARQAELLKAAAEALEDGRDPLHDPFLSDHDVSLDECIGLAEQMALGARFMAWVIENPQLGRGLSP